MANNNVVIVYDQLEAAVTKLENYYTLLEEQQKMISRLDTYFDHLYKIHGTNTTFVATMEDKIQNMALAVKNDMADIDYLKNLINYIIQSYTDAEGKTTLRSNELLLSALGSLVPATTGLTTNIYNNMNEYATAIAADPTKTADITQYNDVKNWKTYTDTNATTADAWDAVHDNTSESGEKYSYKISETGSKISTEAQNVAIQDVDKDVQEAQEKLEETEKKLEEAEKKLAETEQKTAEAQRTAEAEAQKPENTYTETEQVEKKASPTKEAPVTKEKPATTTKETKPATPKAETTQTETTPAPETEPPGETIEPETIPDTVDSDTDVSDELPTPTRKTSSGNKVVPIIAGVAAAGAAGVGAKVFLDKKTNNDIDDDWDENEEYDEYNDTDLSSSGEDNSVLDSSDEFTYKADLDEDYSDVDLGEDNFSDVSEEEEVQGYQAINFNDISETH